MLLSDVLIEWKYKPIQHHLSDTNGTGFLFNHLSSCFKHAPYNYPIACVRTERKVSSQCTYEKHQQRFLACNKGQPWCQKRIRIPEYSDSSSEYSLTLETLGAHFDRHVNRYLMGGSIETQWHLRQFWEADMGSVCILWVIRETSINLSAFNTPSITKTSPLLALLPQSLKTRWQHTVESPWIGMQGLILSTTSQDQILHVSNFSAFRSLFINQTLE